MSSICLRSSATSSAMSLMRLSSSLAVRASSCNISLETTGLQRRQSDSSVICGPRLSLRAMYSSSTGCRLTTTHLSSLLPIMFRARSVLAMSWGHIPVTWLIPVNVIFSSYLFSSGFFSQSSLSV
ncbi:hypothetical protein NP493_3535g00007 [Ridgeia piscesae]|uniref:Uncharacterized protein n=1 Tax=Ridgeia piscesae TaxID=27915 RepID=A0AAD9J5T0_RIDPI|nr:hypothetical protein NP493_3535g00007 [Ridgeia piscesae]